MPSVLELRVELKDEGRRLRVCAGSDVVVDCRDQDPVLDLVGDTRSADGRLGLGRELFARLDGPARGLAAVLSDSTDDLVLLIDADDPRVRRLPWELLAQESGYVTASGPRFVLPVRALDRDHAGPAVKNGPLRVLFMAASPEGGGAPLAYDEEEARIQRAIGTDAILEVEESGTVAGLARRLRGFDRFHYDVVHITGHATVAGDVAVFQFEDEHGRPDPVSVDRLVREIDGRWPRLFMVSGCRTGDAPGDGTLPSFVESLVEAGVPAALGWGRSVGDVSATEAAAALYGELAVGGRIDRGSGAARRALLEGHSSNWWDFQLYALVEGTGALVTPPSTVERERIALRQPPRARFLKAGQVEICEPDRYVGRRREIQGALRVLDDRSVGAPAGVLIHGMGGYGKSSMAARLCDRIRGAGLVVAVSELDEVDLIQEVGEHLRAEDAVDLANESRPLQRRIEDALRLVESGGGRNEQVDRLLFVFDNFEDSIDGINPSQGVVDLPPDFRGTFVPGVAVVVGAVVDAIGAVGARSRVIATSRYPFDAAGRRLHEVGLRAMGADDVRRQIRASLPAGAAAAGVSPELIARVETVGAGNPRLTDRLLALVASRTDDAGALLDEIDGVVGEYREQLCLWRLLDSLDDDAIAAAAAMQTFGLPMPADSLAQGWSDAMVTALDRAVALTVVDQTSRNGRLEYSLSALVAPLLAEPGDAERDAAADATAWCWEVNGALADAELHELWRTHLAVDRCDVANRAATRLVHRWYGTAANAAAINLALATEEQCPSWQLDGAAARCLEFAGRDGARERYNRALDAIEATGIDTLENAEAEQAAAVLHNLAGLEAQSGNVAKARELYEESLTIKEQIGDARGKAATLHQLAGLEAQSGNVAKARELYEESLTIEEQIGNARGKAATLANLAVLEYNDDEAQARARLWSAAAILGGIGAWPDLASVLHLLVQTEGDDLDRTIAAAQSLLVSLSGMATAGRLSSAVSVLLSSGVLDEGTQCAGIYLAAALLEDDAAAGLIAEARADLGVKRTNEEWLAHHGVNTQEVATARFAAGLAPFMDDETWVLPRVGGA